MGVRDPGDINRVLALTRVALWQCNLIDRSIDIQDRIENPSFQTQNILRRLL